MGQCFRATPYKSYAPYLEVENLASLKEQWPPIKLYKLKKLFESKSHMMQKTNEKVISYESFLLLLPELTEECYSTYSEQHKRRLFALFDKEQVGYLTWNNFFLGYTLCQFGSEEILAVLMFALFDYDLKHRLTQTQLTDLLNCNSKYLREDGSIEIDEQTALEGLLGENKSISIEEWITDSEIYIDYLKFKKMFNVWAEEELEKNMAEGFHQLNELFDEAKSKYIGYLVNYKWFESWKTYIHKEYGIQINGFSNNLTYNRTMKTLRTQKSFKTKKSIRSLKSSKSFRSSKSIHSIKSLKRTVDFPRLREIYYDRDDDDHIGQYNLIYSNIGDKPAEIYNNLLEGEFCEILIPELIQNIHYIIVSEEVWRRLKLIYGAYPEFRRTGEKAMEIYPKNFKIFTKFHKGRIDFQEEKICEFSNFMSLDTLISKIMNIELEELQTFRVFFKSCSIFKWEELLNLNTRTSEISSEQIIFLAIVAKEQASEFIEVNCVAAEGTKDIHVGDEFIYIDPVEKFQRRAIFMGRSKNKMIVHFRGTSYIYDLCVDRQDFIQRSFLCKKAVESSRNKVKLEDLQLVGLPNSKGLGFINSVLLSLFSNEDIFRILATFYKAEPQTLIEYLAYIAHMLANNYQARTVMVSDMIRKYFFEFSNFQFTMCEPFIDEFFDSLHEHFSKLNYINFQNPASDYLIEILHNAKCSFCQRQTSDKNVLFSLTLPIPNEETKYYEIIYVPFAYSLKGIQIRKYAMALANHSTFKQYKQAFEKTAELKNHHYFLAEVHGNNIIKNYINAKDEATLENLLLREDDLIFAYELCFRLDGFINDHYSNDAVPKLKNLKVGQMVDFQTEKSPKRASSKKKVRIEGDRKHEGRQDMRKMWNFGKIIKIDIEPYTHKWLIEIQHRENRVQVVSSTINPEKTNIASFPTKSYLSCDQYHIRVLNRIYNEVTNEMEICNIPLVVMVASWMRMKEVELLVYQQVRHLIADNYKFKIGEEGYQQQEGQSKINKKEKIKKFKEYLYNSNKPYKVIFTDLEGRCSVCCKIQKSQVLENEEEFICEGCQLDPDTPIFWQIRPYQAKVCVDWIALDSFIKPYFSQHNSYTTTKAARKNSVESLSQCLRERLKALGDFDQCCCSFTGQKKMICTQRILNVPERLIFVFDRMIEEEENYKHINRKYIHFQIDEMSFNGETYQLVAATSIEGSQVDAKFITYLREKSYWLEYNGEHVKIVKKTVVQKICVLLLQYKRIIKNEKRMTAIRE